MRLVSWPEDPPTEAETGEPSVELDTEGEWCLTRRDPPVTPLGPPCVSEDRLANEDANRGLPEVVGARERWPE